MEDIHFILEDLSSVNLWNYKCCICTCLWIMGQCVCVQMLYSTIYYNPSSAHYDLYNPNPKYIGMCIMVALHCCINILNCISKNLFTNIKEVSLYFIISVLKIPSLHI